MATEGSAGDRVATASKPCVLCGIDCAGKPRVKDPQGRYYCKACHDTASAEREAAGRRAPPPPPPASGGFGGDDLASLAALAAGAPVAPPTAVACPSCRRILDQGAVVCVGCGYDLRSGRAAKTKVTKASPAGGRPTGQGIGGRLFASVVSGPLSVGGGALAFATAYVTVVASVPDQLAWRDPAMVARMSWGMLFGMTAVVGILASLLYFLIAPWFFRVRLQWAGGSIDPETSRRVYFVTVLPYAVWSAFMALLTVNTFDTPIAAKLSESVFHGLVAPFVGLGLLCLGTLPLFLMASQGCGGRKVPSFLLLVALPIGWYVVQVVLVVAAAVALAVASPKAFAKVTGTTAMVSAPQQFAAQPDAPYAFDYPANWQVEVDDVDPEMEFRGLRIQGVDGSTLGIQLSGGSGLATPQEIIDGVASGLRGEGLALEPRGELARLGPFNGTGRTFLGTADGDRVTVQVLVHRAAGERVLLLVSLVRLPDDADGAAGIDLILRTLRLTSGR